MTPSLTDCSDKDLTKAARKLGFVLFEGKKHTKVKTASGEFVTTIPRHRLIKRPTAKSIVKAFKQHGANAREIEKAIRC